MSSNDSVKDDADSHAWANTGYKAYITDLLLQYVTANGAVDNAEAFRQVMAITDRAIGTVKNWLSYKINIPDLESLARIAHHWRIPPEEIFPPHLATLLGAGNSSASTPPPSLGKVLADKDSLLVSLYAPSNPNNIDLALSRYTDQPKSTILYRQEGTDMQDAILPGELMLVDASCEQIRGSGIYLLKYFGGGDIENKCVRMVEMLVGQQSARLNCANRMLRNSGETVPLEGGNLPSHITVLGRVVGVLKQT